MIRRILIAPNPILRRKAKPVTKIDKKTLEIIQDLIDTATASKETQGIASVGLAAPQINYPLKVIVIKINAKYQPKYQPFINPKITWSSSKTLSSSLKQGESFPLEGCLSIPNVYGFVDRPITIKAEWLDQKGKARKAKLSSREAIYFQHEYDHLEGILFVDHILKQKGRLYKTEINGEGQERLTEINNQ